MDRGFDDREPVVQLLANAKARLPELEEQLARVSSHWGYEDAVYRFYHQSWKVYRVQGSTEDIVALLQSLLPDRPLNVWFKEIVASGTGKTFENEHNQRWLEETRPIIEAFFHARYFLERVVQYAKELERPPNMLPSGWAAVLYLYDLR